VTGTPDPSPPASDGTTGYVKVFEVRLDDVDPNRHLTSSAYLDYAVHTRVSYLDSRGMMRRLEQAGLAPVVFRDEIEYRRELRLSEQVRVTMELVGLSDDGSRWRLQHDFLRDDGTRCARIRSEGAWFDLGSRRLVQPPDDVAAALAALTRTDDYGPLSARRVSA
jgi:acyl-CoA thioester hydrolase